MMIEQSQEKNRGNLHKYLQIIKTFWNVFTMYVVKIYSFFKDNKNNSKIMLVLAIITFSIAVYFAIQLYNDIIYLRAKTPELLNLKSYDIRILQGHPLVQPIIRKSDTINDLIEENISIQKEITKYTDYIANLQVPYTYFLQYIYLPSLNIWKETYTNRIDTTLMGIKFLEKNPFNDITLIQKRGDFFKNLGDNNEYNEIKDMKIGDIVEHESGYFSMPITVSFQANSKRAFLLLSDKLSMTSNKENISLINEFFYYLWNEIKKHKEKEIKTLKEEYLSIFGTGEIQNENKIIGYHLYNWIFHNAKNILIDNTIIDKTVKSIISCNNTSNEVCYYKFRERYKNIPSFGYVIGTDFSINGAENLKTFIQHLPPIFSIKSFEFDKIKAPTFTNITNTAYQGKVTIVVYGRSINQQEIDEIANALGEKCLGEHIPLTIQEGLDLIQSAILKLSEISTIDKSYNDNLRELKGIVEQLDKEYSSLSNYKKTIKLFELYRMLSDSGLCK